MSKPSIYPYETLKTFQDSSERLLNPERAAEYKLRNVARRPYTRALGGMVARHVDPDTGNNMAQEVLKGLSRPKRLLVERKGSAAQQLLGVTIMGDRGEFDSLLHVRLAYNCTGDATSYTGLTTQIHSVEPGVTWTEDWALRPWIRGESAHLNNPGPVEEEAYGYDRTSKVVAVIKSLNLELEAIIQDLPPGTAA